MPQDKKEWYVKAPALKFLRDTREYPDLSPPFPSIASFLLQRIIEWLRSEGILMMIIQF